VTVWIYVDTSKQVGDEDHLEGLRKRGRCEPVVCRAWRGRSRLWVCSVVL